ncbi:hypothetical protein M752DRAFT_104160 [Aspergillus phoenicis ATCC 13157]|uniref:Uncharacterized protein n=1 Tax=Aspergillus phoenicis ATCC 13157 TaxID=1353007 RepID=A0A370PWN3_ASPPH|nr:hypothetical protein M752DRAFT_104160 [Aspergillus phoenicis ATCC 13157]
MERVYIQVLAVLDSSLTMSMSLWLAGYYRGTTFSALPPYTGHIPRIFRSCCETSPIPSTTRYFHPTL